MDLSNPPPDRLSRHHAGSRERGGSPWLGRGAPPSDAFRRYQELWRAGGALASPWADGISPATTGGAFVDWAAHLVTSPAKLWELVQFGTAQWQRLLQIAAEDSHADSRVEPLPQDKRFADPLWQQQPYATWAQAFLLRQQWWQRAATGVPGLSRHHEEMVSFAARQWLDMLSPSNFVSLNPVLQRRTRDERGLNLLRGTLHAMEDTWREMLDLPPAGAEAFRVGEDLAVTPGRVVLRNGLMELIQYEPTTARTHPEPVLLVPAWIMKYYILDLSPHNSLVKYLVDRGFTVFVISWKNPDASDRDVGFEAYHRLGVRAALDAIGAIVPGARTHAMGYCLGGTLLATAAAALARDKSPALASMTLLAAQTDFTDPGELSLFIDESQVAHLEDVMWRTGYLDKRQMRDTFRMIRSADLVWSYRLLNHLLGERVPMTDVMAWNADGTRLPMRMHSEYLHAMFLDNALARGDFVLDGAPVDLHDIRVPVFNVATVQDHVAPWRSVYKLRRLCLADQTFVLTAGGHNVGIVNPPGNPKASYRIAAWRHTDSVRTSDEWLAENAPIEGSWWTAWADWLRRHSSPRAAPPEMGAPDAGLPPLQAAPGTDVHQR